jgi:hypothetical protein
MEGKNKQSLKNKQDYLDNIQVSRESITVFNKVTKSFPDLSDIAHELMYLEQANIAQEYKELVDHIRSIGNSYE